VSYFKTSRDKKKKKKESEKRRSQKAKKHGKNGAALGVQYHATM
jgi:hypothetical protein